MSVACSLHSKHTSYIRKPWQSTPRSLSLTPYFVTFAPDQRQFRTAWHALGVSFDQCVDDLTTDKVMPAGHTTSGSVMLWYSPEPSLLLANCLMAGITALLTVSLTWQTNTSTAVFGRCTQCCHCIALVVVSPMGCSSTDHRMRIHLSYLQMVPSTGTVDVLSPHQAAA